MSPDPPPGYPRITPYLNYEDSGAMLELLARACGLVERRSQYCPDGAVHRAEMASEEGLVMPGTPGREFRNPRHLGRTT